MSEWRECKLGEVIQTNVSSLSSTYPYSDILYLDTGSITSGKIDSYQKIAINEAPSRAKRLVKDKNIVYSTVRPIQRHYGFIKNPPKNLVVSTGFTVIETINELADSLFIYYLLSADDVVELLDSIAEGSTSAYPSLKPSDIENLDVTLPPFPEQKAIAGVLSSLDDKIDLLHRQNKTLEAMAEALFRQWFVEEAGEGWEEKPLSSIADFLNGLACQKYPPRNDVDKLPVLKIRELSNGISENTDWITTDINKSYIVENGDVIFAWSASLMVKIWDGEKCVLNQHLFKVTSEKYPKWFYFMWCKFHLNEFIAISETHATTMGHIKRGDLDNAMVLIPSDLELKKMNNTIEPIIEKIITNYNQLRILEKLRNTLLPKLMSGEVRVET